MVAVEPVQVPGGAGFVAVQVFQQHGNFVFGADARGAIDLGKRLMAAGRASLTGLVLPPNADVGALNDEA